MVKRSRHELNLKQHINRMQVDYQNLPFLCNPKDCKMWESLEVDGKISLKNSENQN
jgi:hypothetical protein